MPSNASMIFVVSAKDDASKTIEQINRQIANVGKGAGSGGGKGIELPGFDLGQITQSIQQMGSAGGALGVIGDLIPVAGLGVAAAAVGAVTWQLGEAGAQTLRTKDAFASLAAGAGTSAQSMLSAMQMASRGTVADADLMAAANRALVLGVATSAQQMADLTAAAITRGRQVGVGATQAISDLVTGIGRMSPEILDNLGIANAKSAFDTYAATLGTTADKLTDVQKKQALVNAVLESTKGVQVVDDAAASFERMDAAIQNAKDALGEMFGPAIAAIAQKLADTVNAGMDMTKTDGIAASIQKWADLSAELQKARDNLSDLQALQGKLANVEPAFLPVDLQTVDPRDVQAQIASQQQTVASLLAQTNAARQAAFQAQGLKEVTAATKQEAQAAALSWHNLAGAIQTSTTEANINAVALANVKARMAEVAAQADVTGSALTSAFVGMAQVLGAAGALTGLQDKQRELIGLQQAWNYMGLSEQEIQFREAEWLQQTNEQLSTQRGEWEKLTGRVQAHAGGVSEAQKAYDGLLGKVQGVLNAALDPGVGINPDDILPRPEAINENARRLAAIARDGLQGQDWLGDFAKEAPGAYADLMLKIASGMDAKSAAASILKDFQDGLRPDLLNKDIAKDMVRRSILGEQSMGQLAQEIAAELSAELGVSLQQAQDAAASVLGTGKGQTSGGAAVADGIATGANGAGIVEQIAVKMEASYTRLFTAGQGAGTQWGAGFMTTVETSINVPLINLLVALVTPGVMAQIAAQTSQTTPPGS